MAQRAIRILHVIPQFPYVGARTVIGGHASALLSLARAQAAAGDEVTILSYVHGRGGETALGERLRVHGLFQQARPGRIAFGMRFGRAAVRWAAGRAASFDLVHGHSGFADYLLVSRRLAGALRLPTLHTLYCPVPPRGRWHWPPLRGAIRRAAQRLAALVAVSDNVARSMRAYRLPEPRRIPMAVDTDRFRPGPGEEARRELGLGLDEPAVLFVGNATARKNLAGVLRAMHQVRSRYTGARLVITTELPQSSPDRALQALRRQIADLGLESCVVQKGIVDDMPALMQACDVLVAPFLDTIGPSDYFMAALEAMACGRPVVVSAVGGMPEVVSPETGRLVDPRNPGAIASALEELLGDEPRRRAAGAAARRYTQGHFEPSLIAASYRSLYEELLRRPRSGGGARDKP